MLDFGDRSRFVRVVCDVVVYSCVGSAFVYACMEGAGVACVGGEVWLATGDRRRFLLVSISVMCYQSTRSPCLSI